MNPEWRFTDGLENKEARLREGVSGQSRKDQAAEWLDDWKVEVDHIILGDPRLLRKIS